MENSIEEIIKIIERKIKEAEHYTDITGLCLTLDKELCNAFINILSDYKKILKENEIYKKNSEIMSKENLSTAEQLKVEIKENFRLKNQLENKRKEYQATYKDVREELKELRKENEELNEKILDNAGIYQLGFKDGEESYIKKVKDKIEEEKLPLVIVGGRRNKRTLEYGIKLGRRQALQELLGSEE